MKTVPLKLVVHLKKQFFTVLLVCLVAFSYAQQQVKIVSWNLCNFGKSKSDEEIAFIANTVKDADILAVQEISDSYYGAQALAKLAAELNRKGSKWDYVLSAPTHGNGSERYAFLWKTTHIKLISKPWLETSLDDVIDREPMLARFEVQGKKMLLATMHAVPKSKEPWKECKYLYRLNELYNADNLMIMGDFNLTEKDKAFDKLKYAGIVSGLQGQKTSLKMEMRGTEKFANEYDNIFYEVAAISMKKSGILDFTGQFPSLKEARKISDHVPVYIIITVK